MLTYHKYGPVPITQGLYHNKYLIHQLLKCDWNTLKSHLNLPGANELTTQAHPRTAMKLENDTL